ncbi:ABC transporter substrate-binding protein [Treponema sp. OttesenSCG-928-L16]|nr:ABC transporter substrate-binding protein [Treponema sp. OttesenSCG-928-L16]
MGLLEQAESANTENKTKRNLLRNIFILIAAFLWITAFFIKCRKPAAEAEKNVSLSFVHWWEDQLEEGTLASITEEFEARYPRINIKPEYIPYGTLQKRLQDSAEETKVPGDIIALDPRWAGMLKQNDLLLALDDAAGEPASGSSFISSPGNEFPDIIPLVSFINVLFYNIDILSEQGFDRPPKNRGEFLSYARTIGNSAAPKQSLVLALGKGNADGIYEDIYSWIWASGQQMMSEGRPGFSSAQTLEILGFLRQLYDEKLLEQGLFSNTGRDKLKQFAEGNACMMTGPVSAIAALRKENPGLNFGITVIPGSSAYFGKPIFSSHCWYAGILKESAHPEEALLFLSFLDEKSTALGLASHGIPWESAAINEYIDQDPLYGKAFDIYSAGESSGEFYCNPNPFSFEDIVRQEVIRFFNRLQSAEETAERINSQWEALIDRQS